MSGDRRAWVSTVASILFSSAHDAVFFTITDRLLRKGLKSGTEDEYLERDMGSSQGKFWCRGCGRAHSRAPHAVGERGCPLSHRSPYSTKARSTTKWPWLPLRASSKPNWRR